MIESETPAIGGSASVRGSAHRETDVSPVSRETRDDFASPVSHQAVRDRRRATRPLIAGADGRMRHVGSTYSADEIDQLRRLFAANCATKDIAAHFAATPHAITMLAQRHGIKRPRPSVAEVLAGKEIPGAGVAPLAGAVEMPVSQPMAAGGGSTPSIPVVELIDRFEKHIDDVELREIDERRQCRVVRRHGDKAGQWATFPLWQIRFYAGTDRKQEIAAALERGQQTAARRAARQSSNEGERNA